MGFHVCQFCRGNKESKYSITSSGDVFLSFNSGRSYIMPDMILHYIYDHGWVPPQEFIDDIMHGEIAETGRRQTRETTGPIPVGYLKGSFKQGNVPAGFVEKLEILMVAASQSGDRFQTKSLILS